MHPLFERGYGASSGCEEALKQQVKVILLTPTPDQRVDIMDSQTSLK